MSPGYKPRHDGIRVTGLCCLGKGANITDEMKTTAWPYWI